MAPEQILQRVYEKASATLSETVVPDATIQSRIAYICQNLSNRAGVRLLMACLLAKLDNPSIDLRKPYTEIGDADAFSGRSYDEAYLTHFINTYRLPCNPTTAFLTPALRNITRPLTTDIRIAGSPPKLYVETLQLLDDVHEARIDPETAFVETVRVLINMRDEKLGRMASLIESLKRSEDALPLSSEGILKLIGQHLASRNASRLPVLIVAAAYRAAEARLGERALPLRSHNAADLQTGSIGDVEICLIGDDNIVTAYEMKMKRVTIDDIDAALTKIARAPSPIDNYIFVTTEVAEPKVIEYAASLYESTNGVEIAILDCLGFLRHYLHLFHRIRTDFLNAYQEILMVEPDSAVSQALKEAFLALRQAAESDE
jgi:hypothetical protein